MGVKIMQTKVLITGGAGFIGSHLADKLARNGLGHVLVLDNMRRGRLENLRECRDRVTVCIGDILDRRVLAECAKQCNIIFHLAAQSNVIGSAQDGDYCFAANVEGTFNVLEAARAAGVRRVVFSSSREVYGDAETLPVPESAPLAPKNAYGTSKAAGEVYCRAWRNTGIEVVILRFANVYGARDSGRVIPIFIENALAGNPIVVYGGSQIVDFVWIGDVVDALVQAGLGEYIQTPVNLGSGRGVTVQELAQRVLQVAGSSSQVRYMASRAIEVTRFEADTTMAHRLFHIETRLDPLWRLGDVVESIRSAHSASASTATGPKFLAVSVPVG
jgi:UDP-glucose 4-epimerase